MSADGMFLVLAVTMCSDDFQPLFPQTTGVSLFCLTSVKRHKTSQGPFYVHPTKIAYCQLARSFLQYAEQLFYPFLASSTAVDTLLC